MTQVQHNKESDKNNIYDKSCEECDRVLIDWIKSKSVKLTFNWTRIFDDFFEEYGKTFSRSKKVSSQLSFSCDLFEFKFEI